MSFKKQRLEEIKQVGESLGQKSEEHRERGLSRCGGALSGLTLMKGERGGGEVGYKEASVQP